MCEIEQYLDQVRAQLEVSFHRANEIIAEARCHLEARARDLEAKGMGREQAEAEAVRGFGNPQTVAAELRKANARHRDADVFRLVVGIGLAFGTTLSAIGCFVFLLMRAPSSIQAALYAHIIWFPAFALPGAVLAGMVAGRRYWWLAATPPLLFMALCWGFSLAAWAFVPYRDAGTQLDVALVWPLLSAAAFAVCGYLGARAGEARRLRYPIGVLCAVYALGIAVPAFAQVVRNLFDLVMAMAVAEGVSYILLIAAYRDKLVGPRVLIAGGAGMTALVAAMAVAVLAGTWGLDTLYGEGRTAFIGPLLVVVYLYLPAQLVWLGWKGRKVSEAAQAVRGRPNRGA